MTYFIGSILMALIALWYLGTRVRARFQHVDKAVDRTRKKLAHSAGYEQAYVIEWEVYPLSDYMIKKIANDAGFEFERKGTSGGASALVFSPPKRPRRKLSLDV